MKGNKSKDDKPETVQDVWHRAFGDFCLALDKFGPKEVLPLLITHSHRDEVVHQLLLRFPTVVALGDFIASLPIFKPPKQRRHRNPKRG